MALLVDTAGMNATRLSKVDADMFVVKVTCDSSYATGGYSFHPDYYAPFHVHDVRAADNGGYGAAWDRSTNKLLVTRGGNECVNATDLTGIEFTIQLWKYGNFPEATMAQTTPIQTGAAGPYLKNNTNDAVTAGTTTWNSGTTQVLDTGSIHSIKGAVIQEGKVIITADGQDISTASNLIIDNTTPTPIQTVTGGIRDGQIWRITASAAKEIYDGVAHAATSNILLPGNVDFTTGDGDDYQLRYDETAGKYIFEIIHLQP